MAVVGTAEVEIRAKVDKFEKDLRKGVEGPTGAIGKFQGALGGLEKSLQKVGLSSRDVSVIMGAGLAGGIAFAARSVIDFANAAVEANSALNEQKSATDALFESASGIVETFARGAAAMGLSERAALQASNAFGDLFTNIGLNDESAAKLSVGLTALAADLASFKDISTDDALLKLRSGLVGETEALRSLGVVIDEATVKAKAQELGLGDAHRELTGGEKILARYNLILELTGNAQGDVSRTSDSLANQQRRLNAEWENSKARLGQGLLPAVNFVTGALADYLSINEKVQKTQEDGTVVLEKQESSWRELGRTLLGPFGGRVFFPKKEADDAADSTDELAEAARILGLDETELAVALGGTAASAEDLTKAEEKLAAATERVSDAHTRLNRAIGDAERRVDRAETTLARAFEDSELRIDKAERNLAEAFEDRSERIADAEQNLADARIDAFRSVRDARENLADFERDSADKIADAERGVADAKRERAKSVQEARFALESAMRAGDAEAENEARRRLKDAASGAQLADAQRSLAEAKAERDREGTRLERELAEARIDAAKKVEEAQLALARTYDDTAERIEEAQRDIRDAHRDAARAIADAQRGLEDAMRDGAEAVADAKEQLDEYTDAIEKARTALQLLNKDLETTGDKIQRVADILTDPQFMEMVPKGSLADALLNPELEGKAAGGPVVAGGWNVVGEEGPELVKWGASGTVVSNADIVAALERMGKGSGVNVHMNVGHQDPNVLANVLSYKLAQLVN